MSNRPNRHRFEGRTQGFPVGRMAHILDAKPGDPIGTDFDPSRWEMVDERGLVKHSCGHSVLWELLPGVADDWLKAVSFSACPCCGGEEGKVPDGLEWPDHALYAGVGLAHCHEQSLSCADVRKAHALGLAIKASRNN